MGKKTLSNTNGLFCGYCGRKIINIYNPGRELTPGCTAHGIDVPIVKDLAEIKTEAAWKIWRRDHE